jgi:hypothetical protein
VGRRSDCFRLVQKPLHLEHEAFCFLDHLFDLLTLEVPEGHVIGGLAIFEYSVEDSAPGRIDEPGLREVLVYGAAQARVFDKLLAHFQQHCTCSIEAGVICAVCREIEAVCQEL